MLRIATSEIGSGNVFVIAEAGVNHNGDLGRALDMIDVAAAAGADAVKFQTFRAEQLVVASAPKAAYQQAQTGGGGQREMLQALELGESDHLKLIERCSDRRILFLSTPFDQESADFLESLSVAAFKIPSGEITNLPFLRHVAVKRKPMIVSTGMADLEEVAAAVGAITSAGNSDVILLQCVSQYPTDPKDANLRAMATMRERFGCPVGYSDHTLGTAVAVAAAALGAAVIEKHFTLDRTLPGPDHRASLEPPELARMIEEIRTATAALGTGEKRPSESERDTARVARKSVVAACDIPAGAVIEAGQVAARRPGTGIPPSQIDRVIGRHALRAIPADTVIEWNHIA